MGERPPGATMRLYIETMDAVLVEVAVDGRVRFEGGSWTKPSIQERRAIIHAAQSELAELNDLVEVLERPAQ